MIEPGKRYTATEKAMLERQGYEFADATDIRDSEPMYVVSGFRALHETNEPPPYRHPGEWDNPGCR